MSEAPPPENRAGRTWREGIRLFGPAVMVSVLALIITYWFVEPAPPSHLELATGPEDGAYFYFGQRYRELLAREGISVNVRATFGSIENLHLLSERAVDLAFVQGGTGASADAPDLRSLASLYFEPLWVFVRADAPLKELRDLRGHRVAVGREGSGTRAVALQLLADNAVEYDATVMVPLSGSEAARALRSGGIDAAFFVVAPRSVIVRQLLRAAEVRLLSIERAAAYVLQHRFLSKLTLPQGAIDLAANLPPADTVLVAPAATLVVRQDFHPALSELLLGIAKQIHGEPGLFEDAGQFPSRKYLDFPISEQARRFFDSGPSLLQRYLPFWAANSVDRLKIMLLPLATLLYPLFKIVPPTYDWRMRSRINRWYEDLQAIERKLDAGGSPDDLRWQLAELDRIEQSVRRLSVPLSYASALYTLRLHIDLLRGELQRALQRKEH